MKISSMGNRTSGGEKLAGSGHKTSHLSGEGIDFNKTLGQVSQEKHQEALERLILEVDRYAAKLSKSCTLNDLRNYKRAVKNFLKETIGKSYGTENKKGRDRMSRQRVYVLIKKVEQKLEELSREVLSKQKNQLSVLEKIDEIRGMLVDMYM